MKDRTRIGLEILQAAACIGLLGDILLRSTPWGINVLLFNLAFAAAVIFLLKRHAPERLTAQTIGLIAAIIFFASMFVIRDAIELRVADTFAIVILLGVAFLPTLKIAARLAGVFQYAASFVWAGLNSLFGGFALLGFDIRWNEMSLTGWRRHALSVVRGLLIAMPLLVIFGALFMAADAVYEGWVRQMLNIDFENAFGHIALFAVFGWLSAGYLRGMLINGTWPATAAAAVADSAADTTPMSRVSAESGEYPVTLPDDRTVVEHMNLPDPPEVSEKPAEKSSAWSFADLNNSIIPGFAFGPVETGVVLGLLNLLFLSFVIFQLPYLFGGFAHVQTTPDLKLADYARSGFGELVIVSALALPVLLAVHWLIKRGSAAATRIFSVLAITQIVLLFVIMASAAQRLALLTGELGYGLTTVRLYPMIFMIWLAIVFVWFAFTVVRGRRQYFAWAALWSAIIVLGATHFLNPDAFIARHNIALMQAGRPFDAAYADELSADAVPDLLAALPSMQIAEQCRTKHGLLDLYGDLGEASDLRSLNISRRRAFHLLAANAETLHRTDSCPAYTPRVRADESQ